jgi:hypothetical protein
MVEFVVGLEQLGEARIADLEVMDTLGVFGKVVVQVAMVDAHGKLLGYA